MTGIFPALTSAVDEMAETGYSLRRACSCGAAFPGPIRACPLTLPHKSRTLARATSQVSAL
jgi:hypothetical protein